MPVPGPLISIPVLECTKQGQMLYLLAKSCNLADMAMDQLRAEQPNEELRSKGINIVIPP